MLKKPRHRITTAPPTAAFSGCTFNGHCSLLLIIYVLSRSLPDLRDNWCKEPGRLLETLPRTSVIVCFHNEAWSVVTSAAND